MNYGIPASIVLTDAEDEVRDEIHCRFLLCEKSEQ